MFTIQACIWSSETGLNSDAQPDTIRKPKKYMSNQLDDLAQIDCDSAFQIASEEECQRWNIKLFVLPPMPP